MSTVCQKNFDDGSGGRERGKQRSGWMNGVKVALGNRMMTVDAIGRSGKP